VGRFFVPGTTNDKEAESVYRNILESVALSHKWRLTDRRIWKIRFRDDETGKSEELEVGKIEPSGRAVIAILETVDPPSRFLVYVKKRAGPFEVMLIPKIDDGDATEFDADAATITPKNLEGVPAKEKRRSRRSGGRGGTVAKKKRRPKRNVGRH
jgi:hypothetical protein